MPRFTAEGVERYIAELEASAKAAISEIKSKLAVATTDEDRRNLGRRIAEVRAELKRKKREAQGSLF